MSKKVFRPDWYGVGAKLQERHQDYSVISCQCDGGGTLYEYVLFPGIDLIFMDFICKDVFEETTEVRDIIEIHHCSEGRVEADIDRQRVLQLQQDEIFINFMANMPYGYSLPFEYCKGLSLVIDRSALTEETIHQFSIYGINISTIGYDLELERQWYIYKTPFTMSRIFSELYAAKGKAPIQYFRIKVLELLYYTLQLQKEDSVPATYHSREQLDIVRRVRKTMLEDLSSIIPLDELLQSEPISKDTFRTVFKQVYGRSPYAYLKNYKMNQAAVQLRESSESINQIALSLGYNNASKFTKAFRDVYGMLPKDYRTQ